MLTAVSLLAARRKRRLCFAKNPAGIFLLVCSLGLGACFSRFADDALRAMNLPVVCLSAALALASLTGANPLSPLSGPGLRLGIRRFLPSFIRHWALPFRAAAVIRQKTGLSRLKGLGAGLALGAFAVMIAMSLLLSADSVFDALFQAAVRRVTNLDGAFPLRLMLSVLCGLCLFSFLFSFQDPPASARNPAERSYSPVTLSTVLVMLSSVYAVFVYVQFRALFGGAETARMAGGYAEYARSGFFQLVILSLLTLLLILPCIRWGRESRPVRCLCALTAALTIVIVFSAFFRMRLYIQAFGLSVLRVVTLWGIAMILLALGAGIVKCWLPDQRICPFLTVLALSSWLALNWLNVDGIVARHQVRLYNEGTLTEIDVSYLASLSPDVLPALADIRDDEARQRVLSSAEELIRPETPLPYDWSLSWLFHPGEQ